MTPHPISVGPDVTFGHAMLLMQEHGVRHLPVVENGKPIGMVAARAALDPELEEFVCEVRRREAFRYGRGTPFAHAGFSMRTEAHRD